MFFVVWIIFYLNISILFKLTLKLLFQITLIIDIISGFSGHALGTINIIRKKGENNTVKLEDYLSFLW
ncbi:MAG: hypothetical protein CMP52_07190 [Flavobacteriales bacterium]|nr:hypothetical protein [Candidatus Arcticimaribacter sp.]